MLKHILIILCLLIALCCTAAAETAIDAVFAKDVVDKHALYTEEAYLQTLHTLDGLSENQLQQLNNLIKQDMESEAGEIVSTVPIERRIAGRLINAIDDHLGALEYTHVLDGRFLDYKGSGTVSYYYFKTIQGKITEVFIAASTLKPDYEYRENYEDYVRLFVNAGYPDSPAGHVVKIEMLEPLPSGEILSLTSLRLKNSPDYYSLVPEDAQEEP